MFHAALLAAALQRPAVVAFSRCNAINTGQLEDRVRSFARSVPAPDARDTRFSALQRIVADADQEALILQSACGEHDLRPLVARLQATQAWAFALESDLAHVEYSEQCPAADRPVTAGFIAAGWLRLMVAERGDPSPPAIVGRVEARLRRRAAATSLTLPSQANTSDYWMRGIQQVGRTAAKACKQ